MVCWPQVLAECEDVAVDASKVLHTSDHLLLCLPQPQHQRRFCIHIRIGFLRIRKNVHRLFVVGPSIPHVSLESLHRLHIVGIHVQPRPGQTADGRLVSLKVRNQALHQHLGLDGFQILHCLCEVVCSSVLHVISVHRCHDDVVHPPPSDFACCVEGLLWVCRGGLGVCLDRAEPAASGARVSQEHDRGSPAVPALPYVRTLGLLTDCM
mmetsp:Transcript_15491/g.31444  ORF Transcript_15491/g.31444 Transcript_15491/m.31444 type:complete len:209 (+) Transcript_15491:695-1321(+)